MRWKLFWIITIVFNLMVFTCIVRADEVKLEWDELAFWCKGYTIYWGTESGNYSYKKDVGHIFTTSIEMAPLKHAYISVACYDDEGNESTFSNEVEWGVKAPTGMQIVEEEKK